MLKISHFYGPYSIATVERSIFKTSFRQKKLKKANLWIWKNPFRNILEMCAFQFNFFDILRVKLQIPEPHIFSKSCKKCKILIFKKIKFLKQATFYTKNTNCVHFCIIISFCNNFLSYYKILDSKSFSMSC